jgi:hypothetical protein
LWGTLLVYPICVLIFTLNVNPGRMPDAGGGDLGRPSLARNGESRGEQTST